MFNFENGKGKNIAFYTSKPMQGPLKQMDGIALNGPGPWQDWLKP